LPAGYPTRRSNTSAFLFFAEEGRVRRRHLDEQTNQTLPQPRLERVITWNTVTVRGTPSPTSPLTWN